MAERQRRIPRAAAAGALATALAAAAVGVAHGAFGANASNDGNVVSAASDFRAPAVTAAVVAKSAGGATGWVRPGGTYHVYANVGPDGGAPPSGLASVTADATALGGGAAVALTAGSYTAGGVAYGYRSAALTASGGLAEGPRAVTVRATDNAGNTDSAPAAATVDATPPQAVDVQTTDGGGTNDLTQEGDTIVFTFSEPIEPQSLLAGWDGAPTPVVVRVIDNGLLALPLGNDVVQVYNASNSATIPLGTVDLGRGDYATGLLGGHFRFGATGSPSLMAAAGDTVVVTLGTYSTLLLNATRTQAGGAGTMVWAPTSGPRDRADNALAVADATESGPSDRDF